MKVTDKLQIIDRISRELQTRYTYDTLVPYLEAHGLKSLPPTGGSKRLYAKQALQGALDATIANIAAELDIGRVDASRPEKWQTTEHLRLFISHISKHKKEARRLQVCLEKYCIDAFVAHEDITPTKEWEAEIMRGLATMEVFVSMHFPGFAENGWCQQEVGWAVSRGVFVIPLMMGEPPTGFISKKQGLIRDPMERAEDIAERIDGLIKGTDLEMRLLNLQMPF